MTVKIDFIDGTMQEFNDATLTWNANAVFSIKQGTKLIYVFGYTIKTLTQGE